MVVIFNQFLLKKLKINNYGKIKVDDIYISPFQYFDIYIYNIIIEMYTIIYALCDYNYGVESEKKVINQLQKFFGNTLTELDYYDQFDFYNEKIIEQKSRRCKIDTYESTRGGMNKINKAKILKIKNTNVFFIFYFTNINYSECDLFNK